MVHNLISISYATTIIAGLFFVCVCVCFSSSFVNIILKFVTTEVDVIIECSFLLATSIKL